MITRAAAATLGALGMLAASTHTPAPTQADTGTRGSCTEVRTPVTINGQTGRIAGTLCGPRDADTIQVLVHGYSYGRYYWAFPMNPNRYSYVQHANQAGYATLAIDRLGVGDSWRPSGFTVTYSNAANALHQVIQTVRNGEHGSYSNVALVGHSLGTVVSYMEAGTFGDVDALIATGGTHALNIPYFTTQFALIVHPAPMDPQLNGHGYGPGYTTTRPGERGVFYHMPNTEQAVVNLDEQLKEGSALTEVLTGLPYPIIDRSGQINVPVLTVVGEHERIFCGGLTGAPCSSGTALASFERGYFGPNAEVAAHVQPDAGHNLNLHRNAPETFAVINNWLGRKLQ